MTKKLKMARRFIAAGVMIAQQQPMNRMNKIILCGLLLCLLGAAGKGYGQEVKPGTVLDWEFGQ